MCSCASGIYRDTGPAIGIKPPVTHRNSRSLPTPFISWGYSLRSPAQAPHSPAPRKHSGKSRVMPRGIHQPQVHLALAPTAGEGKMLKIKPESEELKNHN